MLGLISKRRGYGKLATAQNTKAPYSPHTKGKTGFFQVDHLGSQCVKDRLGHLYSIRLLIVFFSRATKQAGCLMSIKISFAQGWDKENERIGG